MSISYADRLKNRLSRVYPKDRTDAVNIGADADQEIANMWALVLLPEQRAQLRAFLDAAAGEGLVMADIDAAELYGEIFGEGPKMARCNADACAWVGQLSQCRYLAGLGGGVGPLCPDCGETVEVE